MVLGYISFTFDSEVLLMFDLADVWVITLPLDMKVGAVRMKDNKYMYAYFCMQWSGRFDNIVPLSENTDKNHNTVYFT